MSHNRDHIIIGSGKTTVSFGDPNSDPPANPKLQVRHVALGIFGVALVLGLWIGALVG